MIKFLMNHKVKRYVRFAWIITLLIFVGFCIAKYYLGFYAEYYPVNGDQSIIVGYRIGEDTIAVYQKIIVKNEPKGPRCLKKYLIKKYDENYPIDKEQLYKATEKAKKRCIERGEDPAKYSVIKYYRYFYQESKDTPLDWDGSDNMEVEGRERYHYHDKIADIIWIEGEEKQYRMLYEGADPDLPGYHDDRSLFTIPFIFD